MDKELLQLIIQVPVAVIAIYALITSLRSQDQTRNKEMDNDKLRIERESAVALVNAETQNTMAANQATLIQQNDVTQTLIRQMITIVSETRQVIADNSAELKERSAAAREQAASLDSIASSFKAEIAAIGQTMMHAGTTMRASREATDVQLSSIKAGQEHTSAVVDAVKLVIDTLPLDTTKVVLELGDQAMNDHKRIQQAVDAIAVQIDGLPAYLVNSLTPFLEELRSANQQLRDTDAQLRDTETKLLHVVATVIPLSPEALPLNERVADAL